MFHRRLPAEHFTIDCDKTVLPFKEAAKICQEFNFAILRNAFTVSALNALRFDAATHVFRQEQSGLLNIGRSEREEVDWTNEYVTTKPARRNFARAHSWLSDTSLANIGRLASGITAYAQEYPRVALRNNTLTSSYAVRYPHQGFVRSHQDSRPGMFAEIALAGRLHATIAPGDRRTRPLARCVMETNDVIVMPGVVDDYRRPEYRVYHELRNVTEDEPLNSNRQLSLVIGFGDDTIPPAVASA